MRREAGVKGGLRSLGLITVFVLAVASPNAQALTGGAFASSHEAPWAVKTVRVGSSGSKVCTGALVARGLILTAGHCTGQHTCSPRVVQSPRVELHFGNGVVRRRAREIRHPRYACRGTGHDSRSCCPVNDVGFIRFKATRRRRVLRLASPAEIARFVDREATLFGAGRYFTTNGWFVSNWIRKSMNGGFALLPSCERWGSALCFRSAGSRSERGDSGGPYTGWFGGWKQLAVASGYTGAQWNQLNVGASLADPVIRRWVDRRIAARS